MSPRKKLKKTPSIFARKPSLLPKSFITSKRPKTAAISDWLGATTSSVLEKKRPTPRKLTASVQSILKNMSRIGREELRFFKVKVTSKKSPSLGKMVKNVQVFSGKQPIFWGDYVFRKVMSICDPQIGSISFGCLASNSWQSFVTNFQRTTCPRKTDEKNCQNALFGKDFEIQKNQHVLIYVAYRLSMCIHMYIYKYHNMIFSYLT